MNSALINTENDKPIWAIIVVNKMDPAGGNVDYKIRMNFTTVPRTQQAVHKRRKGLLTYYKNYYTSGFLSLQVRNLFLKCLVTLLTLKRSGEYLYRICDELVETFIKYWIMF